MFIGSEFPQFRNGRNIALRTVIPGNRQSLRATESRHMYFKDITLQILDKRTKRKIGNIDRQEYDDMCAPRLYPEVKQYDVLHMKHRVFGRNPKLPIWALGIPHFKDLRIRKIPPVTQTHDVLAKVREIRSASLESDPQGKLNLELRPCLRELETGEGGGGLLRRAVYFYQEMAK